jgi:hypothetical protein
LIELKKVEKYSVFVITSKKEDFKMRTKKWTIIFLLFTGIIFFFGQSAFGGCEITALDPYVVKKAPGTKYSGTLALTFGGLPDNILYIVARIENKKLPYAFAGKVDNIADPEDLLNNPWVIEEFLTDNVIPYLYNCDPEDYCPPVKLKSYSNDVASDNPGAGDNPVWLNAPLEFYILDFQIAVDD